MSGGSGNYRSLMAALAQHYTHNIRSICEVHPELPNVLGTFNLDLRINAGDPINPGQLTQAQGVAYWLKAIQVAGNEPLVTREVVQTAELRLHAIQTVHALAVFTPVDLLNALQNINQNLDNINNVLQDVNNHLGNINNVLQNINDHLDNIDQRVDALSVAIHNVQLQ
ncbi:hypothetical protein BGW80DRAFT_1254558 [Lactifluus volemus]|nr:hypothetical protein BGW80DRAFT_1254558 [Lactifluus volemus]